MIPAKCEPTRVTLGRALRALHAVEAHVAFVQLERGRIVEWLRNEVDHASLEDAVELDNVFPVDVEADRDVATD